MSEAKFEQLAGSVERITFHSSESGFAVLRVKARNQRELVTVVGQAATVHNGEYIDCEGYWITDKQYGIQFKAERLQIVPPNTVEGIEKYLASGLVKGIGPAYAKRLVQAFGKGVFEIIEENPEKLKTVPGIGEKRREVIIKSWAEQKVIRDIIIFLHNHGVGAQRAVRIYKAYGSQSINMVKENPYRLALDIRGIGFKTADQLAMSLGVGKQSMLRIQAGTRHVLQELCSRGHTLIRVDSLIQAAMELLETGPEKVEEAIALEVEEQRMVALKHHKESCVALTYLHQAEQGIAEHLQRLSAGRPSWATESDWEASLQWVQEQTQMELSSSQQSALRTALMEKVVIITGGPGVGKTTLVNSIVKILSRKSEDIALCAPTGRAAKRLSESTGREAKTIHRLLAYDPQSHGFRYNEDEPLTTDCLILDETSMVDVQLFYQLLSAMPDHAALIVVGDVDQLPSVGPGTILKDLIDSQQLPTVCLEEIFRQAASSKIVQNAHAIRQGKAIELQPPADLSDFYFINATDPDTVIEKLRQVVTERIPARFKLNSISDIQVLVPMNKGGLGARAFNEYLQKALNSTNKPSLSKYGWTFKQDDKVIQTVNNYDKDIFNGDIGYVKTINLEEKELWVEFDEKLVCYEETELDELSLAYATTIHKAQGSEYPAVVIPITMAHYPLLERNLIYTGVTRGKRLVVIIGEKRAFQLAVKREMAQKRLTQLKKLLMELMSASSGIPV